jgi:3-methyladenine DNA glycosylase AlkD
MNKTEVMALLRANKNEQGIENWNSRGSGTRRLKSFGIGLTQLRKLAKQIGRDHELALKLWSSDVYDARIIGLLIDEPKRISREQAEAQVDDLRHGPMAHVFASCNSTLGKSPLAVELASAWMSSKDDMRRHCGYLLLYDVSMDKRKSAPDDAFFLERIEHIAGAIADEKNFVQIAMGGALIGAGKRSKRLNAAALKVARAIGPLEYEYIDNSCEPLDLVKHLTSDYLKQKLGVG